MRLTTMRSSVLALALSVQFAVRAQAALVPSADGTMVYDTVMHVTWLADANLPSTQTFGVPGINPSGSMNYATAVAWVAQLNAYNNGAGWLGHNNWTLPTTPQIDSTCNLLGPNGNFGVGCVDDAMSSLFTSLGLQFSDTAVPIPANSVGPF